MKPTAIPPVNKEDCSIFQAETRGDSRENS